LGCGWRLAGCNSRGGETGVRDTSRNQGRQGGAGRIGHAKARRRGASIRRPVSNSAERGDGICAQSPRAGIVEIEWLADHLGAVLRLFSVRNTLFRKEICSHRRSAPGDPDFADRCHARESRRPWRSTQAGTPAGRAEKTLQGLA